MADTKKYEANALLKLYNEKVLPIGISGKDKSDEIVDIISDYPWTAQQFSQRSAESNKTTYTHNIPFCYAIERMQTINSSVAGIINALVGNSEATVAAGTDAAMNLAQTWLGNKKKAETPKPAEEGSTGTGTATPKREDEKKKAESETPANQGSSDEATGFLNFLKNKDTILSNIGSVEKDLSNSITPRLAEGNLQGSTFLEPWKWLYLTKTTSKKFVFPTLKSNSIFNTSNTWGDSKGQVVKFFESLFDKLLQPAAEIAFGIRQFTDFMPKETQSMSFEGYDIENALGYNYKGAQGAEFPCEFVLYNTTKKDAWKKNYRFIVMFILRNSPLRTTLYSIKPPLLYDIIVPGVKHLPLCYVNNVTIDALGHVRNMRCDNFLKEIVSDAKSDTTLVPVPEAWRVSIKFKCLIPDTMNLILNTTSFPINVTTVTR